MTFGKSPTVPACEVKAETRFHLQHSTVQRWWSRVPKTQTTQHYTCNKHMQHISSIRS